MIYLIIINVVICLVLIGTFFMHSNNYLNLNARINAIDLSLRGIQENWNYFGVLDKIDEEITSLMSARSSQLHNADFSSVSITNNRSRSVTQNQIIELYKQKQDYIKEFVLLKPLSFVKSFSKPEKPEDLLWPRVLTITLISLILGFIIAGVKELEKK